MRLFKSDSPDKKLIKGCIKGDTKCYEQLYTRFAPKMFGICLRYSKDYHTAEDILQEGFIKVYKNLAKFRFEGSFEGWVRRIFVNTAIEHFRKSVNLYPIGEFANSPDERVDDLTVEKLAVEDILKMVQSLSPGYRTVFNLYVIEGYPHKDIAKMLGISEGTSKSQLARARYLLQKKITNVEKYNDNILKKYLEEACV